ncbi:hypothetical protein KE336_gp27 [Aeromonas phage 4_D05]|uniref:NinB protein n=1 Tax=Aeromonas phage 4_D05 TaxID=2588099 RepID=A0A514TUA3_9CAUD|nr:hypothetical protein KE336_gp27 [Aeromonas phage 4_D05]QDJ96140.1 hypothetical protein 4D05_027 [Aeromonas phage 4_D05]
MTTITIIDGRDTSELIAKVTAMLADGPVQVKLSGKKARSMSQNNLAHLWFGEISKWLTGHGRDFATPEWCKNAMKHTFLGYDDVFDMDVITGISTRRQELRHTSKLDVGEMKLFMDQVYHWCLEKELMLTIPEDCEYDRLRKEELGI